MEKTDLIKQIADYIEDNLDHELSLDAIAEYAGYSKFYLNRCFQEEVGCTIYKYIQMRRLTEAAYRLAESDKPLIEIALDAGYQSQQAFTNAFRLVYTQTPQNYRIRRQFTPRMPRYSGADISNINRTIMMMRRVAA